MHRAFGKPVAGALRPFDQRHTMLQHLVEAEFIQLFRRRQPVEVEMMHRHPRLVRLNQREGRARHLKVRLAGQRPDQAARQRRLAGAKVAGKCEHIAWP